MRPAEKIVVVGGGPAGLEAARVSAERGHQVVLFEAAGQARRPDPLAAKATWRKDLIGIADWLAGEVEALGVDIRWNSLADDDDGLAEDPEVVIVATGGLPDSDFVPAAMPACRSGTCWRGERLSGGAGL